MERVTFPSTSWLRFEKLPDFIISKKIIPKIGKNTEIEGVEKRVDGRL